MTAGSLAARRGHGVKDVELPIGRVAWVESQAQKTFFAAGENAAGDIEEDRARRRGEIGDHRDTPGLLDNKNAVGFSRRRNDGDRVGEGQGSKGIGESITERRRFLWHAQ